MCCRAGGIDDDVMIDAAIEISMYEAAVAEADRCAIENVPDCS